MRGMVFLAAGLAACASEPALEGEARYFGGDVLRLDETLVSIVARMQAGEDREDVTRYADCAISQYANEEGAGFARHLRTNITERAGIWTADAVYTISVELPLGIKTIDTETTVQSCAEAGIPTI